MRPSLSQTSFQAVPRVSTKYLPGMASVLTHPKVTVHIADGFKYLPTVENTFDVIITDSSDPVGPAASLFEAPYFTLMKKALKEGGNLATQGECLWLHLPLIKVSRSFSNRWKKKAREGRRGKNTEGEDYAAC
jgi:spermidine synthase